MTLGERLAIAKVAGRILARRWTGKVEPEDAIQEAALVALERPDAWWDKHTHSYLVQWITATIYARLIRKRWFIRRSTGGGRSRGKRVEGKRTLERVIEVPYFADSDECVESPYMPYRASYVDRAGFVHLGDWT